MNANEFTTLKSKLRRQHIETYYDGASLLIGKYKPGILFWTVNVIIPGIFALFILFFTILSGLMSLVMILLGIILGIVSLVRWGQISLKKKNNKRHIVLNGRNLAIIENQNKKIYDSSSTQSVSFEIIKNNPVANIEYGSENIFNPLPQGIISITDINNNQENLMHLTDADEKMLTSDLKWITGLLKKHLEIPD